MSDSHSAPYRKQENVVKWICIVQSSPNLTCFIRVLAWRHICVIMSDSHSAPYRKQENVVSWLCIVQSVNWLCIVPKLDMFYKSLGLKTYPCRYWVMVIAPPTGNSIWLCTATHPHRSAFKGCPTGSQQVIYGNARHTQKIPSNCYVQCPTFMKCATACSPTSAGPAQLLGL